MNVIKYLTILDKIMACQKISKEQLWKITVILKSLPPKLTGFNQDIQYLTKV
jgi:hypothetical protein